MLNDILTNQQKSFFTKKHEIALKYFGKLCTEESKYKKWKFIYPLRKAGFTQKDVVRLKFGTSYKLWRKVKEDQIIEKKMEDQKPEKSLIFKINFKFILKLY
jgi:hypothetical protein